jgi:hypothetical protein
MTDEKAYEASCAFVIKNIKQNRTDLMWAIAHAFSGAVVAMEELQGLGDEFTVDDVLETKYGREVLEELIEAWEVKQELRKDKVWAKVAARLANRALYLDRVDVEASVRKDATCKYRFNLGLDSAGLMARMLEHMGVLPDQPVVMNVLNRLPKVKDENGRETSQQHKVPRSEGQLFWEQGYLFSGGKTLWNWNVQELREIFLLAFPTAIDFSSYNRRFRAPLIPSGFLPDVRVRTHNISVGSKRLGADGRGNYDPGHELFAELMAKYGPVVLQFTAVCPETGLVWKGTLFPQEGINEHLAEEEQAPIHFDHLQVKGAHKSAHKALNKLQGNHTVMTNGVYVGIMKAKSSSGRVASCFETLENIGPDPLQYEDGEDDIGFMADKYRVRKILVEMATEAIDRIGELGPEGLLGRACRDDLNLKRLGEFITMANQQGAGINPLDVPILASKTQESLSRTVWGPAQGASMNGKYPIVLIDNLLEAGTCVASGYKPGEEIAVWRFPTILAQGLKVLKVVGAKRRHRVQDKQVPFCIHMHEDDIVTGMQGDDDGDEVGTSDDPRIITLHKLRKDNRIFHIEPAGEKLGHLTDSDEGRKYIMGDPMGPVGKVTIMKAALAAVGRTEYELAFAVLIQEAIDSQKNRVRMTDVHKASDINNWYCDAAGEYHIHYKIDGEYVTDNFASSDAGEFDMNPVQEAYDNEMIAGGCTRVKKTANGTTIMAGWPLGWRTQHRLMVDADGKTIKVKLSKAVAVDNWLLCSQKQDYDGGNWVHMAHDVCLNVWKKWNDSFKSKASIPTKDVLPNVLQAMGIPLEPLSIDWGTYIKTLREVSGLVHYGKEMKKLRSQFNKDGAGTGYMDEQSRLGRIDNLRAELNIKMSALTAQQLLTIWCMELTNCWWYNDKGRVYVTDRSQIPQGKKSWQVNKPNSAFSAVASKHSAIMRLLGFTATEPCSWLSDPARLNRLVGWAKRQPNSYLALTKLVRANKAHGADEHDENGEPIHLGDCPECMERLKTSLVRSVRQDKSAHELDMAKALCTSMNASKHVALTGVEPEDEFSEPMAEEWM